MAEKTQLSAALREGVAPITAAFGVELGNVGVKDVVLPGEVKRMLAQEAEAERAGRAALIAARSETATTRNLVNAARLMADNPALMRLKEIQSLAEVAREPGNTVVLTLPLPCSPPSARGKYGPNPPVPPEGEGAPNSPRGGDPGAATGASRVHDQRVRDGVDEHRQSSGVRRPRAAGPTRATDAARPTLLQERQERRAKRRPTRQGGGRIRNAHHPVRLRRGQHGGAEERRQHARVDVTKGECAPIAGRWRGRRRSARVRARRSARLLSVERRGKKSEGKARSENCCSGEDRIGQLSREGRAP